MNSKKEGELMEKMEFTFPYGDHLYDNYTIPDSEQPDIEPYAGGTRFEYPFAPEQQPLQELGLLDVTKPPFLADSSGEKDCTDALNEAIRTAQRYHYVCYFHWVHTEFQILCRHSSIFGGRITLMTNTVSYSGDIRSC